VHDRKVVRRRRAALGLLVACALILLTAYFGESAGGGLHAIQRGALAVFSPIENVASDAVKPLRDLFGWFGDTFHAKGENEKLRKEVNDLRTRLAQESGDKRRFEQGARFAQLDARVGLEEMKPVTAHVVVSSPNLWYSKVNINRGSGDGVSVHDPVVTGAGLVGLVTATVGDAAQVLLLTDPKSGVTAKIAETGVPGIVQTGTPGNPNDLLMQRIPRGKVPKVGQMVVSAGIESRRYTSYFPPDIPIGVVTKVDLNELDTSQQIHIRPFVDFHDLDSVWVLTEPNPRSTGPE
jgi:rod shape-determining protein MreC